jgi:membrane associated rhomboid family serine protease
MFSFLNNIPQVTKNLLLLNVMLYIVSLFLASNGLDLGQYLGAHYFNSALFQPYQIITHMFMHSLTDFFHILFNMLLLVMFGAHLERLWGPKRFFIFYFASGLGAFLLYNSIGVWELMELKKSLISMGYDLDVLNHKITNNYLEDIEIKMPYHREVLQQYYNYTVSNMVGASGALFGVLAGFGVLFPNTQLMLLFPPIPIKAKYLIGAYLFFEIYSSISGPQDNIAHLAHVGGALVGIALVLFWRKTDRQNFY